MSLPFVLENNYQTPSFGVSLDNLFIEIPYEPFLHAAEDEGRTEDPTEHKKSKAKREEGRIFFSQDLPQAAVVVVVCLFVYFSGSYIVEAMKELFVEFLENPAKVKFSEEQAGYLFMRAIKSFLVCFVPVGLVGMLAVSATTLIQTGGFVTTKNFKFNFKRLMPTIENLKNKTIFSRTHLLNFLKILVKMTLILLVGYFFVKSKFDEFIGLINVDIAKAASLMAAMIMQEVAIIGGLLLLLSIPDWFIQRQEYIEQLKMSKTEIKQEYREMEGDPLVKQRIRQRARELLQNAKMLDRVKEADVVITNPTHFACCIKWEPEQQQDPKLIAKGEDHLALQMREIAKLHGVSIVENKPLARAIHATVEVNEYIPAKFFQPLVEIYKTLDKFKNFGKAA